MGMTLTLRLMMGQQQGVVAGMRQPVVQQQGVQGAQGGLRLQGPRAQHRWILRLSSCRCDVHHFLQQ